VKIFANSAITVFRHSQRLFMLTDKFDYTTTTKSE